MEDLSKKREEIEQLLVEISTKMNHQNVIAKAILRGSYNIKDVVNDEVLLNKLKSIFQSSDEEVQDIMLNSGIAEKGNTSTLMLRDILQSFEKMEDGSYFYEKSKETIELLNLLADAKTALYEILDYYMLNVDGYNYTVNDDKLDLVITKFKQIKLKIVPSMFQEDKVLYVSTKPIRKGDSNEFVQYLGDDDFYFQKSKLDSTVTERNYVYDLSFGNYYIHHEGEWYPAFFAIDDIEGKIKPFYASNGVVFNLLSI